MPQTIVDFYHHRFRRNPHENHCNLNQFRCVIFFFHFFFFRFHICFRRSRCSLFNFRLFVRVCCCAHFSIYFVEVAAVAVATDAAGSRQDIRVGRTCLPGRFGRDQHLPHICSIA